MSGSAFLNQPSGLRTATAALVLVKFILLICPSISINERNGGDLLVSAQATQQSIGSEEPMEDNTIETTYKHVACGTIVTNVTNILVKNPHYPDPTYTKAICETVVERTDPLVNKLRVRFRQLNLYRPTIDGECLHDRFAVYTDLNAAVTPVMCGNLTGKNITVPFTLPLTSLIISVTTSDLDHDRFWEIEIEQEK